MFLEQYRAGFEEQLLLAIDRMGEKSRLRDACEYALLSGGKRLRPVIVLMTADAIGLGLDVYPAAMSVEFFHTASLIADDLPCMDNDSLRRKRPSLHRVFGENLAILASYTLIAEGYGGIRLNQEKMKAVPSCSENASEVALLCLQFATLCGGMQGATHGQFLDLYPPDQSWKTAQRTIIQKTSTLFEISFLFGWLFGGGKTAFLPELRSCARHLGMAFQIADDLEDHAHEIKTGKMNAAFLLGKEKAQLLFTQELNSFRGSLQKLGLWTSPFQELYELLNCCIHK